MMEGKVAHYFVLATNRHSHSLWASQLARATAPVSTPHDFPFEMGSARTELVFPRLSLLIPLPGTNNLLTCVALDLQFLLLFKDLGNPGVSSA